VTSRNPREEGKRGGGGRTHRWLVAGVGSRQRHCDFLVLSPLSLLPSLPFNDQKHGGTLVGENTRGWGLAAREVWGWTNQFPKISEKLTSRDPGWAGPGDRYLRPLFVFVRSFSLRWFYFQISVGKYVQTWKYVQILKLFKIKMFRFKIIQNKKIVQNKNAHFWKRLYFKMFIIEMFKCEIVHI
jgi:hypothetical protein